MTPVIITLKQLREQEEHQGVPIREALEEMLSDLSTPHAKSQALAIWDEMDKEASFYKEKEMEYRKALFMAAFPTPKKGTNTFELGGGWKLKGVHKESVKVLPEQFPLVRVALGALNYSLDDYLKVEYKLDTTAYAAIVADEEKNALVGKILRQMIVTGPAAPTLELVRPKDPK